MSERQLCFFKFSRPLVDLLGQEFFRAVPSEPGVYLFLGDQRRVLYVGQSRNLRLRLSYYKNAQPEREPRRIIRLVHQTQAIELQRCESASVVSLKELYIQFQGGYGMVMPKQSVPMTLSVEDRQRLEQWETSHQTPQQVALHCRIVLAAAAGQANLQIASTLKINRHTASLWRRRVQQEGIQSVWEIAPGRGRKSRIDQTKRETLIQATLQTKPKGMAHWSCRLMAKAQGVSKATVNRLWQAHNLKPHLHRTFKLSRDPKFLAKMTDVVGLYLNPPQNAIVLCLDEKSQIQALDRTQPGLPLKKGRCGTHTHDYKRNGTTTLFAALNVLNGKVVGQCHARHRHQEWLKFLRRLDREFPTVDLHLIMDNYGTHKEPHVKAWLAKHRRFHCHFIPTSSSWLNLVERWFGEISQKAIRNASFVSVPELEQAIANFLEAWNQDPKPFVWTAKVVEIMAKWERARQKLEEIKPGCTVRAKRKPKTKL